MKFSGVSFSREEEAVFFVLTGSMVDIYNHISEKRNVEAARMLSQVKEILFKNPVFLEKIKKAQVNLLANLKHGAR